MRIKHYISLGLFAFVTATAFNNCSGVKFSPNAQDSTVGAQGDPNPSSPPTDNVQTTIKNCNDAVSAGTILTYDQDIVFDDTKVESGRDQVCEFDKGDNLSQKNDFMMARYEQDRKLNLPANAVLCDVQMTTQQQEFKYDDILFLTFNGYILGSDNKTAIQSQLTPEFSARLSSGQSVPVYKFNWLNIRGAPFVNVADDYCLGSDQGAGSCSWPITQESGNIIFNFSPELLIAIGLKAPAGEQSFGFVMTGDNDPDSDCYHEELRFSLHAKYYIP